MKTLQKTDPPSLRTDLYHLRSEPAFGFAARTDRQGQFECSSFPVGEFHVATDVRFAGAAGMIQRYLLDL